MGPGAAVGSRRQSPAWHLTRRFRGGGPRVVVTVFVIVETVTWGLWTGLVVREARLTRTPGREGGRSCPRIGQCRLEQPQRREHLVLLWGLRPGLVGQEEAWSFARG